jgi:predicted Rossmann fold nucleotide-binding protein DprA/Smf involved in DNA uptake
MLALTLVADVGSVTHRQLIEMFCSASRALDAAFAPDVSRAAYEQADELLQRGEAAGLSLTTRSDACYPDALGESHDPPAVL